MKLAELAVDPDRIESGDWVDSIPDCGDLRIRTRGIGNADYRKRRQMLLNARPRRERRSGQLPPEVLDEIALDCLIETCLLDWANLDGPDGQPLPFSKATAREYLANPRYAPLRDACFFAANIVSEDRAEDREDDEKNSSRGSAGGASGAAMVPSESA